MALDVSSVVHIVAIIGSELTKMSIYPVWEAQIALLVSEEVTLLKEYLDFDNVFLKGSAAELP